MGDCLITVTQLREYQELDGVLTPVELKSEIPFSVQRIFWIRNIPDGKSRANHAHRACHQFLVPVAGSFTVVTWAPPECEIEHRMVQGSCGIHVPPLTWVLIHSISSDAIILVLASHAYDVFDYIDSKDELLKCRSLSELNK